MSNEINFPLFLCGLMGAGKSTTGKLLATKLNVDFIDLDELIEKKESQSVPFLFSERGEKYFRNLENKYLVELIDDSFKGVIALGGGTLVSPSNLMLVENGTLIYLDVDIKNLAKRLFKEKGRPLLRDCHTHQEIEQRLNLLLEQRVKQYQICDFQIKANDNSVEKIVNQIISRLKNENT